METHSSAQAFMAKQPHGNRMQYRGAETPANFGDSEAEFLSALHGCVVFREDWRTRLRVSGGDAERWLNGMLTNTAALEDGAGNYSFLLNAQGRIQGDCYLFRAGDHYILETSVDQREKISGWLDHYIIMDDVELADESGETASLAIAGPQAPALLAALDPSFAKERPLVEGTACIGGVYVSVIVDDASCVPYFHLPHRPATFEKLRDELLASGAAMAGADVAERLRIASGVPLFGVDMGERDLAQETSQSRALNFNKGCYLGQEIVERIRSRGQVHRGWRGFTSAEEIKPGAEILAAEKAIGKLTSVAALPLANGHRFAGLGIVRLQPLEERLPLTSNGSSVQPADLPFALAAPEQQHDEDNRSRTNG